MEKSESVLEPIRYIALDRKQLRWETLDLEQLISEDHAARLIWEVSGRLQLSRFEQEQKSREGNAGRPCWPARLLVSVWVYSYTLGVASARAIERMMSHEPGLRWLAANEIINYRTLADFRVQHKEALEGLCAQFLISSQTLTCAAQNPHRGFSKRVLSGDREEAQRARMRATRQRRNSQILRVARLIPRPFCACS